jgi:hypothetical protein
VIVSDDNRKLLFQWMHDRINIPWSEDLRIIGLQNKDLSITGAVAYTDWLEDSVFMHVCVDETAGVRSLLREAFMYPFVTCGKKRVYGMTPITAERALAVSKKLGFEEVTRTPDFVLQMMTREGCRWINDTVRADGT